MFRIVELSRRGAGLNIRDECLVVTFADSESVSIPLAEVSAVLISEPALTISGAVLYSLAEHRIPLVACDRRGMPMSISSEVSSDVSGVDRLLSAQFRQSAATKGRLWRELIRGKIRGQAKVLKKWRRSSVLDALRHQVRSGDTENTEGRAAAIYWRELNVFPHRSRCRDDANAFFNYAYTVLYSAFAREIAIAGLYPRLGIFHHCRDNAFPLASDLMEPFRPAADDAVLTILAGAMCHRLTPETKKLLLKTLFSTSFVAGKGKQSVFAAVRSFVQSYKRTVLSGDAKMFVIPEWVSENVVDGDV